MHRLRTTCAVLLLFFIFSCSTKDPLSPYSVNSPHLLFDDFKIEQGGNDYIYKQNIRIEGGDTSNLSFAYKLTFYKECPNEYETDSEGWLRFDGTEIWTTNNSLDFEFGTQDGIIQNLITQISVKVKHPTGQIEELSSPFKSNRLFGSYLESPTNPNAEYSMGIEFIVRELIGDIYVDGNYAHHFMYRLNTLNENLEVIAQGNWYNSINCPDIHKIVLNSQSEPALTANEANTLTEFQYYVVSRIGVIQSEPSSFIFRASGGHRPVGMIYPQTLAGFGTYHYGFDNLLVSYIPISGSADKHPRELWQINNNYEAINSDDFKLHLRWGYHGQYGDLDGYVTDNPISDTEINMVLDENQINYSSRISAFWLRLDGSYFPIYPQFYNPHVIYRTDGLAWLRIENLNDLSRYCVLENLSDGMHSIELMVEDLQGELSEVVLLNINLVPYKSPQEREGILIVDTDTNNSAYSPELIVDEFYQQITPSLYGQVDEIDIDQSLSPSQLIGYKAVLVHADNPVHSLSLYHHAEALDVYLSNAGNLIISGTNRLRESFGRLFSYCEWWGINNILLPKLGVYDDIGLSEMAVSVLTNPYFINAIGQQNYSDIPLNIENAFNPIVSMREGFSGIMMFDPSLNLNWLYACGVKPTDYPAFPPTQEQYDIYSSKYLGYKHCYEGANVAVLGFPLSYMQQDAAALALQQIISEMLSGSYAMGRN